MLVYVVCNGKLPISGLCSRCLHILKKEAQDATASLGKLSGL